MDEKEYQFLTGSIKGERTWINTSLDGKSHFVFNSLWTSRKQIQLKQYQLKKNIVVDLELNFVTQEQCSKWSSWYYSCRDSKKEWKIWNSLEEVRNVIVNEWIYITSKALLSLAAAANWGKWGKPQKLFSWLGTEIRRYISSICHLSKKKTKNFHLSVLRKKKSQTATF